ncbi:COP9 signalosome complex subunit 9-like [Chiloscyllium plagiosum]|uniref:COP9 signalosome complex subunit 9-like n=1 Tax=Chiloscyllium plagiosum TaxID=36176 RepID=UPI001CB848C2|nr:COP9 signalosome complex subunit 9-like [Chiloscyllium plagiosum]
MKLVSDEMLLEGTGLYVDPEEARRNSGLQMDLAANKEKFHADSFNDFEDLCNDGDIQ